jgi:hypothetical protein
LYLILDIEPTPILNNTRQIDNKFVIRKKLFKELLRLRLSNSGGIMRNKEFDIFVSYSHTDRSLVEQIAKELKRHHILLWYDGWQMKPGDVLRKRILHGIENADYFLVLISEHSLKSSWVDYELNSAMIDEIEKAQVRVIPAIMGSIVHTQLPPDLRAKNHLDFKNDDDFKKSIDALIDLIHPERRERKELLQQLRNPADKSSKTIEELRLIALKYSSWGEYRAIQIAALNGLAKIGGPAAVLAVTDRLMDMGGFASLRKAIKVLEKLRNDGGLLALTATLLKDYRLYEEKLEALCQGASRLGGEETYQLLTKIYQTVGPGHWLGKEYTFKNSLPRALEALSDVSLEDIRYGALLARSTADIPFWAGQITRPEKLSLDQARAYSEKRVPGLITIRKAPIVPDISYWTDGEKMFFQQ